MARNRLIQLARRWRPSAEDPLGDDKKRLLDYLIDNEVTASNPKPIEDLLAVPFGGRYKRSAFQHRIVGPLRREPAVFIGVSNAGLFLVTSAVDAATTLDFYATRLRAEQRHVRSLRALARRTKLFEAVDTESAPAGPAIVYMDESGSPGVGDEHDQHFVVAAVMLESHAELARLEQRFKNALAIVRRDPTGEAKASSFSKRNLRLVLRELSLAEYVWAAVCFDKARLESAGFRDPTTLYRYAFRFVIEDLLAVTWRPTVVLDEYSTPTFQQELAAYLLRHTTGSPQTIQSIRFSQSSKDRLVQLADLVAGAVRAAAMGNDGPLREIEHLSLRVSYWPPPEE
ncbi:DUF3800 domain-containing protein [Luteitalea sp.]|uniref:DUF3800 domain-containing protein n=1 Tax=Luteitalea sp. TaxID=2004800 RepID=UPI0025BD3286|nr:DUF3800 domain-containing protein [Luteitalea sp.]